MYQTCNVNTTSPTIVAAAHNLLRTSSAQKKPRIARSVMVAVHVTQIQRPLFTTKANEAEALNTNKGRLKRELCPQNLPEPLSYLLDLLPRGCLDLQEPSSAPYLLQGLKYYRTAISIFRTSIV